MEVVGAVFTDGERVLACRRNGDLEAGGRWEFPGGKIEDGEEPAAALEREVLEELGVEVEVGELLDRSTTMADGTAITLSCFFVRPVGEAPTSSTDHDELGWFQQDRLLWLNWTAPDFPAVRKLVFAGEGGS